MMHLNFTSCPADPDVWMRPAVRPTADGKGFKYWEYLLAYVDDVLCISNDPKLVMLLIEKNLH